jgi:hypothetical protein
MATWTAHGTAALQSALATLCRQLDAAAAHSAAAAAVAGAHTQYYYQYQQQQQQQQPEPVAVTAQLLITLCSELYTGHSGMLHASSGGIDTTFAAVPASTTAATATTAAIDETQLTALKQTLEPLRIQMYRSLGIVMGASLRSRVPLPLRLSAELWQQLADQLFTANTDSGDSGDSLEKRECVEATAMYSGIKSQVRSVLYTCMRCICTSQY